MSVNKKITSLADEVRTLTNTSPLMTLDDMTSNLNVINSEVDTEADLISQILNVLIYKATIAGESPRDEFCIHVLKTNQWAGPESGVIDGTVCGISTDSTAAQCAFHFRGIGNVAPANALEVLLYLKGDVSTIKEHVVFEIYDNDDPTKGVQWHLGQLAPQLTGGWHRVILPLAACSAISISDFGAIGGGRFYAYGTDNNVTVAIDSIALVEAASNIIQISDVTKVGKNISNIESVLAILNNLP